MVTLGSEEVTDQSVPASSKLGFWMGVGVGEQEQMDRPPRETVEVTLTVTVEMPPFMETVEVTGGSVTKLVVVDVNERSISRVVVDIPAGTVLKSVVVESSVNVVVPSGTETVVVEVIVVTVGQVGGGDVVELVLLREVLDVDVTRQEQALEIRDGR